MIIQAFNSETDNKVRMNKIYGILNSVKNESLIANIERVEGLLKSWGASVEAKSTGGDDIKTLKRENAELKKNYKELKQNFLTQVPNPSEAELKSQVDSKFTLRAKEDLRL